MNKSGQSVSGESYASVGAPYEPEQVRLQREVDQFTQSLEYEKSQLQIIEEQIRQTKDELAERQKVIAARKPSELKEKQSKIIINRTKNEITAEQLMLNQTKAENQASRREIDVMRKELTSCKSEQKRLERDIQKVIRDAEEENRKSLAISRLAEQTKVQIIAIMAKFEEEKNRFDVVIQGYNEQLARKDDDQGTFEEKRKQKEQEEKEAAEKEVKAEFANPIVILKRRLNKIIETNKEKRKLMDQYLRNVRVIEDAFDQIKKATGISNIDEIVTTFIKAEEQNYSLFNYVNTLNTEYDQLEEANEDIKRSIQRIEETAKLSKEEKLNLQFSLEDEVKMLMSEIEQSVTEAAKTKEMFAKIQQFVAAMVDMFKQSKFYLCVAQKQDYKDGITFTENNIVQYLAEVEEYISSLITYTAFKNEKDDAAITYIPLENLEPKDHNKAQITLQKGEAPMGIEIRDVDDEAHPGEPAEYEVVTAKDLYKRFNEHQGSGNLQLLFEMNKKNQQAAADGEDDLD